MIKEIFPLIILAILISPDFVINNSVGDSSYVSANLVKVQLKEIYYSKQISDHARESLRASVRMYTQTVGGSWKQVGSYLEDKRLTYPSSSFKPSSELILGGNSYPTGSSLLYAIKPLDWHLG